MRSSTSLRSVGFLTTALVATSASAGAGSAGAQARATATALVGATVIDVVKGEAVPAQDVLIEGNRITWVGPTGSRRLPPGTVTVPIRGRYVIPGLWDMHIHLTSGRWAEPNVVTDSVSRLAVGYYRGLLLASGVTGVRDMSGDLALLRRIDRDWRSPDRRQIGPRLLATGEKLGIHAVVPGAPAQVATPADIRRSIELLEQAHADHVKLGGMEPDLVLAALADCRTRKLRCAAHFPNNVPAATASDSGLTSFEHLFDLPQNVSTIPFDQYLSWRREALEPALWQRVAYRLHLRFRPRKEPDTAWTTPDPARLAALSRVLVRNHTWVTPTLILHDLLSRVTPYDSMARNHALMIEAPTEGLMGEKRSADRLAAARTRYAATEALVRELDRNGVGLLAGTDAPLQCVPGYAIHDELALLVRAGLSPAEALRAATLNPGRYVGGDSLGVVAAGRVADLAVLSGNPLESIANVRRVELVAKDGVVLTTVDLESLKAGARRALDALRTMPGVMKRQSTPSK